MSVCTTRPSGEVNRTSGLVRVDGKKGDKIIWGKPGARLQYILEKQTHRSLCWRASGFAQSFTWERLEEPEMPEALEAHDWPLRKEDNTARRARQEGEYEAREMPRDREPTIAERLDAILGRSGSSRCPALELLCGRWCPVTVAADFEPTSDHDGAFTVAADFEPTPDHDGAFNRAWREPGTPDVVSDRLARSSQLSAIADGEELISSSGTPSDDAGDKTAKGAAKGEQK